MSTKTTLYATHARSLLATTRHGVLATTSVTESGYPFGSLTPYLIDERGRMTIYISLIAEHYRNLERDPRGSILVADPFGGRDPQASPRATVLLDFAPLPSAEKEAITKLYEQRFPHSINYEIAHNFLFMRGEPQRVRWIGGFGEIGWIDRETFQRARPDPLAEDALAIIDHMNEDHGEALREILMGLCAIDPGRKTVSMTGISANGVTIELFSHGESSKHHIPFPAPISPNDARGAIIGLLHESRRRLKTP